MRTTTILVAGLLALSLTMVPAGVAHHADDASDADVEGEYYVTIDEDDGLTLWEESNGHDGLQTSQTSYEPGEDGCVDGDRDARGGTCYAPADQPVEL